MKIVYGDFRFETDETDAFKVLDMVSEMFDRRVGLTFKPKIPKAENDESEQTWRDRPPLL